MNFAHSLIKPGDILLADCLKGEYSLNSFKRVCALPGLSRRAPPVCCNAPSARRSEPEGGAFPFAAELSGGAA